MTGIDLEGIMLYENKADRERYHIFTYMWSLKKKKTNEQRKQKQTHKYRELIVARGVEGGSGGMGEIGKGN